MVGDSQSRFRHLKEMVVKERIDAKVTREGKRAVMLQVKARSEGFGSMRCQIDYHLDSERMAEAVFEAGADAERLLDGMSVNVKDIATVNEYLDACHKALVGVMLAIKNAMPAG